ncbi:Hypothetical predicted protein [Cloeon dipterum]|uniref:Uncharacterized protein n=1 Tax=Cloeon dipterum TaxID=197152 RepID=A0A8S1C4B4_9INSE|nr:Hypothetical predicted protein [Cloeon dipterum]
MAFKFVVFAACLAAANAGVVAPLSYGAPAAYAAPAYASYAAPAVSAVSSNTLRSFGNVGQVSTYSKALDTPFSSVRKTDIRVTNDAPHLRCLRRPRLHQLPSPTLIAARGLHSPALGSPKPAPACADYAVPINQLSAPYAAPPSAWIAAPVVRHTALTHTAYAAPAAYAAPVAKVASPALLGVAYSAAPAVAHMTFQGYGINYAY